MIYFLTLGKAVIFMTVSTIEEIQKKNARNYVDYFKKLKKDNPNESKEAARKELIKMGLLSSDGKRKETIVSWE